MTVKCSHCSASNKKNNIFCKNCGAKLIGDFDFYKKIKRSAFFAFIMGILSFELFYILSDFLIIKKESYSLYMQSAIIVPVLGLAGSLIYVRYKIASGLTMIFSGLMHIFPYLFFLSTLSFITELKNLDSIHNLLFYGVTTPGIIGGSLLIKTAFLGLKRAIETEHKSIKMPIMVTILISVLTAVITYIIFLNLMRH